MDMLKEVLVQIESREEYIADNGHAPRDETIKTMPQMYASNQVKWWQVSPLLDVCYVDQ